MPTLNELGRALRAQLAEIVTGGDAPIELDKTFVTWCSPGIPYAETDFEFAAKGLGTGLTAEDEKRMLNQAFNFASMVDFVPDAAGLLTYDQQVEVHKVSQARLSHMYGEIIRFSKVADKGLSEADQAKLDNWMSKLRVTVKKKDLLTDMEYEVSEDSPAVRSYNEYSAKYNTARIAYNAKRIAAAVATGPEGKAAVLDYALNQAAYRQLVDNAALEWEASGHRSQIDQLRASIAQLTSRSMKLWKQRLLNTLNDSQIASLGPGQAFLYTTPFPGNFVGATGWSGYGVSSAKMTSDIETHSSSWSAGGAVGWGFWSVGGGASGYSMSHTENQSVNSFALTFELAQIPISRPWFYPEFFMNRGWKLDSGTGWTYGDDPSNGKRPPAGLFVGYPTAVLFARNISIRSAEFVSHFRSHASGVSGSASVGWGPFTISGSYSRSDSGQHFDSASDGQTLTVPGMQVLGFVNHLIPKSPDPLPDLKPEDFS